MAVAAIMASGHAERLAHPFTGSDQVSRPICSFPIHVKRRQPRQQLLGGVAFLWLHAGVNLQARHTGDGKATLLAEAAQKLHGTALAAQMT